MSFFEKESYQSPNDPKLSVKAQKTGTHKLHDSGDINSCSTNLLATYDINATDGLKQQIPQVHALKASQNKPLPYSMDHLIDQAENLSIHDDNANKNVNSVVEKSDQDAANDLLTVARLLFEAGKTAESLKAANSAYALVPDAKTAKKIVKLKEFLAKEASEYESQASICENKLQSSRKLMPSQCTASPELHGQDPSSQMSSDVHDSAQPVKCQVADKSVKEANNLLTMARLHYKESRFSESIAALQRAFKLDPNPMTARKIDRIRALLPKTQMPDDEVEDKTGGRNSQSPPGQGDAATKAAQLESKARQLCHQKHYCAALKLLQRADRLLPNDKFKRRIGRLEDIIRQAEEEESEEEEDENARESEDDEVQSNPDDGEDDDEISRLVERASNLSIRVDSKAPSSSDPGMVEISSGFRIPESLCGKLYDYQKEGIAWLWKLHKSSTGGILADDMGLGKTFQTIAFLTGYFLSEEARKRRRTVIVLAPVSVINTWQTEFSKWAPSLKLFTYYELTKAARLRGLANIQRRGGILLTTYNMLVSGLQDIGTDQSDTRAVTPWHSVTNAPAATKITIEGASFTYDYMILDEAHRIKNTSTKIAKVVRAISSEHRLLLTGTAVQNNLRELWSLFDFTHCGRLLGTQKTFLVEYEKPIMRSRERDASGAERLHGKLMADSLQKMIAPYILRRTKADTLTKLVVGDSSKRLPRKNEIVVWVFLSPLQETIYRDFLKLDHVKELLFGATKRSPLVELTILKKLCDHPRLLSPDQCANLGLEVSQGLPGSDIRAPSREVLLKESGKLVFLVRLLEKFQEDALATGRPAHRTLIFSQSLRLLNMAEAAIIGVNESTSRRPELPKHRVLRLDGRLTKLSERLDILETFAKDRSYTAMLLTTQVGGVGLTITSANRVVILDPSWNPSVDAQAIDRVYRIGQQSNVVVYRLITCATVEEKIYRRQVFKDSVIRQTIGRAASDGPKSATANDNNNVSDPYRYFTRQELVDLFKLDENSHFSATQCQLAELHGPSERKSDDELEKHLAFITGPHMSDVVFNISDHDLLFSRPEEQENPVLQESEGRLLDAQFAQNRLKYGEAAIQLEAQGQFVAAERLRNPTMAFSVPMTQEKYQPADGQYFIPSKADSRRSFLKDRGPADFFDRLKRAQTPLPVSGSQESPVMRLEKPYSGLVEDCASVNLTGTDADKCLPRISLPSVKSVERVEQPATSPEVFTRPSALTTSTPPPVSGSQEAPVRHSEKSYSSLVGDCASTNLSDTDAEESLPRISLPSVDSAERAKQPAVSPEVFAQPSALPPHIRKPQATSSPLLSKQKQPLIPSSTSDDAYGTSGDADMIILDLTQPLMDDAALEHSMQMTSLRKSLAKSRILPEDGQISPSRSKMQNFHMSVDDVTHRETSKSLILSVDNNSILKSNDHSDRKSTNSQRIGNYEASMSVDASRYGNESKISETGITEDVVDDSCAEKASINAPETPQTLDDSVEIIDESFLE